MRMSAMRVRASRRVWGAALLALGLLAGVAAPLGAQPAQPAPPQNVLVRVVISGEVLPLQLARVGQVVKQGDPIVYLRGTTSQAAVPGAVASVDGRVVQMMVRPGDRVNIGDVVAVIQPQPR
jgi:biotin carboxyl carrier protein